MHIIERTIPKDGFSYMHPVCIGFEKSDINEKGQLIIPKGVSEIDIDEKYKDFETEVEEIVMSDDLKKVSLGTFRNIKAKCVNIPKNLALSDYVYMFNEALETIKIAGGVLNSSSVCDYYPKLNKIIIENGELRCGAAKIHSHLKTLEISDKCKQAVVDLGAFSSLDEIKFPQKFNPNITLKMNYSTSKFMINGLGNDNLLQLLQYCPEAYLYIDKETCDDIFRYNAKNAITNGMAARAQLHYFKDVHSDIALLKAIKEKMKKDEDFHMTPEAKFLVAMSDFHKE